MFAALVGLLWISLFPGIFLSDLFLKKEKTLLEYLSLSTLISLVANFFIVFYLSIFFSVSLQNVIISHILLASLIVMFRKKANLAFDFSFRSMKFQPSVLSGFAWFFVILVLFLQFVYSAFFPLISYDALASYSAEAKGIYLTGHFVYKGYPNIYQKNYYPQFLSSLYSILYFFGGFDVGNIMHLLPFLTGLIGLFYVYKLTEELGGSGILACSILLMTNWLLIHFNSGYSDIMEMTFSIATLYYLHRSLNSRGLKDFALTGFFAGAVALIKIYGIYVVFGIAIAFFLTSVSGLELRKSIRDSLLLLCVSLLVAGQWYAFDLYSSEPYLTSAFRLHSSDNAGVADWGSKDLASNYLIRPGFGIWNIWMDNQIQVNLAVLLGILLMAYSLLKSDNCLYPISVFSLLFFVAWLFLLAFMLRGLAISYSGIAILSSLAIVKLNSKASVFLTGIFKEKTVATLALAFFLLGALFIYSMQKGLLNLTQAAEGCPFNLPLQNLPWLPFFLAITFAAVYTVLKNYRSSPSEGARQVLPAICLLFFLPPVLYSLYFSYVGLSVGCIHVPEGTSVLSLSMNSDDQKLSAILPGFYDSMFFIKENIPPEDSILITDARPRTFLIGYDLSSKDPDYVFYVEGSSFRDWNRPSWAGTDVEKDLSNNTGRYFKKIYSSRPFIIYTVNKTAINQYTNANMSKKP